MKPTSTYRDPGSMNFKTVDLEQLKVMSWKITGKSNTIRPKPEIFIARCAQQVSTWGSPFRVTSGLIWKKKYTSAINVHSKPTWGVRLQHTWKFCTRNRLNIQSALFQTATFVQSTPLVWSYILIYCWPTCEMSFSVRSIRLQLPYWLSPAIDTPHA